MRFQVSVEAKALHDKLKKLDGEALSQVARVVQRAARDLQTEVKRAVGTPVGAKRGGRSRPGQAPRKETGRLQESVQIKNGKNALTMYVTVNAADEKGNRYPFMLEAGTKTVRKRPFIKKAQRKIKKQFVRELVDVARRVR